MSDDSDHADRMRRKEARYREAGYFDPVVTVVRASLYCRCPHAEIQRSPRRGGPGRPARARPVPDRSAQRRAAGRQGLAARGEARRAPAPAIIARYG